MLFYLLLYNENKKKLNISNVVIGLNIRSVFPLKHIRIIDTFRIHDTISTYNMIQDECKLRQEWRRVLDCLFLRAYRTQRKLVCAVRIGSHCVPYAS